MSDQEAYMSDPPLHLDGTTLEGGGQLLRLALSLSSLTHIPIHVTEIRGKRGKISSPGSAGGLKPAHLAGVEWLAKATAARTEGMKVKSRELVFRPSTTRSAIVMDGSQSEGAGVWKDVYQDGKMVRRESRISMATPGAITLILQAILPYVLFCGSATISDQYETVPLHITIEGGTNVTNSPSIEYVDQVLLPMLSLKLGISPVSTTLHKRGWSSGRNQVGSVTFAIEPLYSASTLPTFVFQDRGSLAKVHVSILVPGVSIRNIVRNMVTTKLLAFYPDIDILFPVDEDSRSDKRLYILLVAETSNGYRLGCDWLFDMKSKGSAVEQKCERLVSKVIKDLKRELEHGGCVDEYMQDQLVIYQALVVGRAQVDGGKGKEGTLHTRTARWVAEQILGLNFDEAGQCEGVGLVVGEDYKNVKIIEQETAELLTFPSYQTSPFTRHLRK
ncbi:hypothetical protein N7G274_003576 [Stereocaulon virgatum]|uniref:RNA 3'-terminal phosphate cyclase domain-containing protein n=1 Tax=Stereocaulon virgatum TaxID=373712 RepID=A0ABR4AE62_9LECA